MGGNGRVGRLTGRSRGIGGGGGISTVDASITWDKIAPVTYPPASTNIESDHPGISFIGCETTTLNAS